MRNADKIARMQRLVTEGLESGLSDRSMAESVEAARREAMVSGAGKPPRILPRHELPPADIGALELRLYEYNRQATGHDDGKGLAFVALDAGDGLIGAVAGYSWAGIAEIRQLWVDEAHRGQGIGRRLLDAAVAEAAARGCRAVWTASYSFQAPGFYEKAGFRREAELKDWPPGHSHVVLCRRLG